MIGKNNQKKKRHRHDDVAASAMMRAHGSRLTYSTGNLYSNPEGIGFRKNLLWREI